LVGGLINIGYRPKRARPIFECFYHHAVQDNGFLWGGVLRRCSAAIASASAA
jgi:hypothetical protein